MCTNTKEIRNKYTNEKIRVKCGHCPACLMEKAIANCDKIINQHHKDLICWFLTLTYQSDSVPYITEDDINNFHPSSDIVHFGKQFYPDSYEVPVYRDVDVRRVRANKEYSIYSRRKKKTSVIGTTFISCPLPIECKLPYLRGNKGRTIYKGKIGVLQFEDIQKFLKRLRINLKRHYGYNDYFKVFYVGEYGETYYRPHFHVLVWTTSAVQEYFKYSVMQSWPFCDYYKLGSNKFCQIAKDANSYVAAYVNSTTYLPTILKASETHKPKTCHSIHFGLNSEIFNPENVRQMLDRNTLEYFVQTIGKDRKARVDSLCIPCYVLSTYFPKFKGYSRLNDIERRNVFENPKALLAKLKELEYNEDILISLSKPVISKLRSGKAADIYVDVKYKFNKEVDDVVTNINKIYRAQNFWSKYGVGKTEFAHMAVKAWYLRDMYLLKRQYDPVETVFDWFEKYDNIKYIFDEFEDNISNNVCSIINESLYDIYSQQSESVRHSFPRDPNDFTSVKKRTKLLEDQHFQAVKKSKVNNFMYNELGVNI